MFQYQRLGMALLSFVILFVAVVFQHPLLSYGRNILQSRSNALNSTGRQISEVNDDLVVDLGYGRYKGFYNRDLGLNTWLGVRYAASTAGLNRWQRPKSPEVDRGSVHDAVAFPQLCPQSLAPPSPPDFNFTGGEDCLFLSVYAPPDAKDLPVLFTIHGGAFLVGSGQNDLASLIKTGNRSFIGVDIQYRLGAFGFLSSEEIKQNGVLNAGLLDQLFALEWTKSFIHLFGGDPNRVTIGGESAGGASVLHLSLAYGATLGTSLFQNVWAASPFLTPIWEFNDPFPTHAFKKFVEDVGCNDTATDSKSFECLVNAPVNVLQRANFNIGTTGGGFNLTKTLPFLPVIDGDFIREAPTKALARGKLNGLNLLTGTMANEGPLFAPPNITTANDLDNYIKTLIPAFTPSDIKDLLAIYAPAPPISEPILYATTALDSPTALYQSSYATGYQQLAYAIYAEKTLICPSYYLSAAFSDPAPQSSNNPITYRSKSDDSPHQRRKSYRYQDSVPGALHGDDLGAWFSGPSPPFPSLPLPQVFITAARNILGNFVTTSVPRVNGGDDAIIDDWPLYSPEKPLQVNLNITGTGTVEAPSGGTGGGNVTVVRNDDSVRNSFTVVDAATWEGGRGKRCEYWASVAEKVPF